MAMRAYLCPLTRIGAIWNNGRLSPLRRAYPDHVDTVRRGLDCDHNIWQLTSLRGFILACPLSQPNNSPDLAVAHGVLTA
jgi:hypothetical protein